MSKIFIALMLCYSFLNASMWKIVESIELSKDEFYSRAVKEKDSEREFALNFRWTLFHNRGLVMHLNYDKFVYQFILYQRYHNDSFKLQLLDSANSNNFENPYIRLEFKDFKDGKAKLNLLIYDPKERVIWQEKNDK